LRRVTTASLKFNTEMSVTFFSILFVNVLATQALWCYQCNSSHHENCLESLTGDASLAPEPCDTYAARYCVKTTGIYGAVMGITRFCSSYHLGNECQYLSFPDHDRMYRACVFTCKTEACNSANQFQSHQIFFLITSLSMSLPTIGAFIT
ncbi:U-scoloptoxin(05)-Sm1a, partial [Clonorchis sinensis]